MSLDDVKVHYNSSAPERLGAAAYAQGTDIHVAPGQEKHVPHEAWHVVQQKQGRVQPTLQRKEAVVNDDPGLEREADEMGSRAMRVSAAAGIAQLKSMEGKSSTVMQFARHEQADPLLANGRNLLEDTDKLLAGEKRDAVEADKFLDTTYDNVGDNLILDIDMLYEEHLQRAIEHDGFFTAAMRGTVEVIHRYVNFQAVENDALDGDVRDAQSEFIMDYENSLLVDRPDQLRDDTDKELTIEKLKDAGWKFEAERGGPEEKRMATGYAKLMKMLETQLPYFGGSVEYFESDRDNLEYWIYHMSTLTKDPQRQYPADSPKAKLPKPMMDYRTRPGMKVPHNNQRNLGTGIVELRWEKLPLTIKTLMHKALLDVFSNADAETATSEVHKGTVRAGRESRKQKFLELSGRNDLVTEAGVNTEALAEALPELWGRSGEEDRKTIFGDILMVPWSKAHIPTPDEMGQEGMHEVPHENVAGVMGNVLEVPERAAKQYREELQKFPNKPASLRMFNHETQSGQKLDKKTILKEFADKHGKWYQDAKENHKPIIGGISGHTLGYLNLYEQALANAKKWEKRAEGNMLKARKAGKRSEAEKMRKELETQKKMRRNHYPKMEVVRANMLGALIGDKRHHSYDEVMAASHGMLTHDAKGQLSYNYPESYQDVLSSAIGEVRGAAVKAKNETKASIAEPESNTILGRLLTNRVIPVKRIGSFKDRLRQYLNSHLSRDQADGIVIFINDAVRERGPVQQEQDDVDGGKQRE
ncbi:DUF4157 domain-containing protein [Paenibacillus sp. TRM 82003]|nr:DUF4157 domain-containing protein [Paenibacillus sp. TRM 82003]